MERQPPERKESGEESLASRDKPVERFKAFTRHLLAVSREELAEQEAKYAQKKKF